MAFPVPGIAATYAENTGLVTNHPVNLPAVLSGKCTILFVVNGTITVTTPTGWDKLLGPNATPASYDTINVYHRDLDGSEGATVTFNCSGAARACAIAVASTGGRSGFSSSELAISAIVENGNVATADPPNLAPVTGADDWLWLALATAGDGNTTFTSHPTNYTGLAHVENGAGSGNAVAMAYRQLNASSEDPGVFTYNNTKFRAGVTIAIRPTGGARTGTVSVTEANDTLSATATLAIKGTLSSTEAADTLVSTATLALKGTASITEAGDTVSTAAALALKGTLGATEANDTIAATGTLAIKVTLSATEANDTVSATGALAITGTLSIVEQDDTPAGVGAIAITGTLSVTEADDTLAAASQMPIFYPRRGGWDERLEFERRQREWEEDLRRIIDRSWRIASGEIDPITFEEIPPPDYSSVIGTLLDQALSLDRRRVETFIAGEQRRQEDDAIAILLLAA